ncbi:unnamed protein product [Cylicocyclus nassatus]|uniref:Uncharacterized protein n=1 Tax=Cylicocyclus nassatus TaxID=53992 RepID=A0AA36DLC6_CYLNA|nr:unnamed protein product [Cylicocyclus nassatus]
MFTPFSGGAFTFAISAFFIALYIPVLYVFRKNSEFRTVLAYKVMFWTGVTDLGQLFIFLLSGIMAMIQSGFLHFYINKFCGSTLYAFWFAMLYLSIIVTLNRFVSVVLSGYYPVIFHPTNVKWMYLLAVMIFGISWIVKLTPYSSYYFEPTLLKWHYGANDVYAVAIVLTKTRQRPSRRWKEYDSDANLYIELSKAQVIVLL